LSASLPALPFAASDDGELTPAQRRWVVLGILALHGIAFWALLQVNAVRQAVQQVAPIFVSLVAPAESPPVPLPTPKPLPPSPKPLPKPVPRPAPLIAAPPAPTPEPSSFSVAAVPVPPAPPQPAAAAAPAPAAVAVTVVAPSPPPRQLPDSAVQFLQLPEVEYPRLSQRQGETGLVVVRAYVGTGGGAPHSVQIEKSSGHARLDQAALTAVNKARFKPYAEKGQPVEGWALVPIRFELEK
jgi:periplasmic protein TonB